MAAGMMIRGSTTHFMCSGCYFHSRLDTTSQSTVALVRAPAPVAKVRGPSFSQQGYTINFIIRIFCGCYFPALQTSSAKVDLCALSGLKSSFGVLLPSQREKRKLLGGQGKRKLLARATWYSQSKAEREKSF